MQDFFIFQTFISPSVLIVFYYIGAVLIPPLSYMLAKWAFSKYLKDLDSTIKNNFTVKQRLYIFTISVFCFLCMELFWRMMFEFFIAYFDMHDALMRLS